MQILSLKLNNFRCFSSFELEFKSKIILISGLNGSGKTSILESLHYLCYLRSFKTHLIKELVQVDSKIDSSGFSINANILSSGGFDTLQIVTSNNKRVVKLNQKPVLSAKEIYDIYKVVTIDEDDIMLVKGTPEFRRNFIDQFISLIDPSYIALLKKYKVVLSNRNALLSHYKNDYESYILWSEQLFNLSVVIQKKRVEILEILQNESFILSNDILGFDSNITIIYQYARPYNNISSFNQASSFIDSYPNILNNEIIQRRSLFGAHLDDFRVIFNQKNSKAFASRGQQKLIVFLIKLSQINYIKKLNSSNNNNSGPILLVDDFLTDFDDIKINKLIKLMANLSGQVIITCPSKNIALEEQLSSFNAQIINL